jgi:protein-disulfide isomerase
MIMIVSFSQLRIWGSRLGIFCAIIIALLVPTEISATESLAEVNGEVITVENLDEALGVKLAKLQEQMYALKRQQLEALVAERLLAQEAKKRDISVAALLDMEVTANVRLVTEQEIDAMYQEYKGRWKGDEADLRQKIKTSLQRKKLVEQREKFVNSLRSKGKVVISIKPPPITRIEVSSDGAPVRGAQEGPVTLVEFSDFHCPFCKRVQPTLEKLLERYPKQVKLVFRDFPLDKLHPQARRAAEAAQCAHDQGKFWAYHDVLFTQAPQGSSADLERYAGQIGLDMSQFQTCLSEGVHQAAVQKDFVAGTKLGITGTPMFFINGRPLSGALPFERFVQVIEEELAKAKLALGKAAPPS